MNRLMRLWRNKRDADVSHEAHFVCDNETWPTCLVVTHKVCHMRHTDKVCHMRHTDKVCHMRHTDKVCHMRHTLSVSLSHTKCVT